MIDSQWGSVRCSSERMEVLWCESFYIRTDRKITWKYVKYVWLVCALNFRCSLWGAEIVIFVDIRVYRNKSYVSFLFFMFKIPFLLFWRIWNLRQPFFTWIANKFACETIPNELPNETAMALASKWCLPFFTSFNIQYGAIAIYCYTNRKCSLSFSVAIAM